MIKDKRKEKQDLIIEKAREVFLEKGFFNTVMDDIAQRVGLTRRSLYRYFQTKEELAYETTIELLDEWNSYQNDIFLKLEGEGIRRLKSFLDDLIDYMEKRIDVMMYLGEFDFYFKDDGLIKPSSKSIVKFDEIILKSDHLLSEIIKLGKKDGSIREDLDVDLTVATISNVLWSFGQRIAIRSKSIKKESGFSGIDLIYNQVDIYILAIEEVK
nr:TetR/AcrR family transcriptional regulator [Tissierella sp.]